MLQRNVFSYIFTTGRIYSQMGCTGNCILKAVEGKWESPAGKTSKASCLGVALLEHV